MAGIPVAVWSFVGAIAVLWSVGAFLPFDRGTRVFLAVGASIWWWVWGIQSTAIDVWSHGTRHEYVFRELLYLGGVTGLILLVVAGWHTFRLLDPEDDQAESAAANVQQDIQQRGR